MTDKSELFKRLSELIEAEQIELPNLIANPQWRDALERKPYFGMDWGTDEDLPIMGIQVKYSSRVEPDTMYIVSQPSHYGKIKLDYEHEIHKHINQFMARHFNDAWIYGDGYVKQTERPYHWQRFPGESVLEWGDRLFARDLLDNPEIRWEYQKAVWATLFAPLKTVWIRIKKVVAA